MKRYFSLILCCLLVICGTFTAGCKSSALDERNSSENSSQENISGKPLRFCIDIGWGTFYVGGIERPAKAFLELCKNAGGPENVEPEIIPPEGEERDAAIQRLRTEIMSGSGPDVFLVNSCSSYWKSPLFPYPDQSMANRLFLPLNDLMEASQFTNWEEQIPVVMDAGKLEGQQYLLPAAYTFPVTLCKAEIAPQIGETLTRSEVLRSGDPLLRASALYTHGQFGGPYGYYISDLLAPLADYSAGRPAFTEEELLSEILRSAELEQRDLKGEFDSAPGFLRTNFGVDFPADPVSGIAAQGNPLAFLPLFDEDGDISASVTAFAGINANTENPEGAFSLLDYLFSRDYLTRNTPMEVTLCDWLYRSFALPVDGALGQEEFPILSWWLSEENFQAYSNMRDRISTVRFCTPLDGEIDHLFVECGMTFRSEELSESEKQEKIASAVSEAYQALKQMISES